MRYKDITVHPFDVQVKIAIGDKTIPDTLREWNEKFEPEITFDINQYGGTNGVAFRLEVDDIYYYGIALLEGVSMKVILHEVFHIVMKIADTKGTKWSEDSDEWYAYCISNVFEEVWELYNNPEICTV